jgi:MFS family permease
VPFFTGCALLYACALSASIGAPDLVIWAMVRFVLGFALAGIFVGFESWLNDLRPTRRGAGCSRLIS